MSLWNVPVEALTFEQLDTFLKAKLPESDRLDYKREFPADVGKHLAAFANTLGGLLILGVDEVGKSGKPVWPPPDGGGGMAAEDGLRERVLSVARDGVYPSVHARVSPVIENRHLPGKVLLVVRVDESREAPHAVEGGRGVYVYERGDGKSDPIKRAVIDRVAQLLERRRGFEAGREAMVDVEIARAHGVLQPAGPCAWAVVVPCYPWRPLYPSARFCFDRHERIEVGRGVDQFRCQQMPDGSYTRAFKVDDRGGRKPLACSRLHAAGLVFEMAVCEVVTGGTGTVHVDLREVAGLLRRVMKAAVGLYQDERTEEPGHVMVAAGMRNAHGVRLYFQPHVSSREAFLDNTYRAERFVDCPALADAPYQVAAQLVEDFAYSFDMSEIPNLLDAIQRGW